MKEKLWSPGKPRKVWVVWYEDDDPYPWEKSVYFHKIEAESHARELLRDVASEALRDFDEGEPDEVDRPRETLLSILETLEKDLDAAFAEWEDFRNDFGSDKQIFFEEAVLYGA
jgi:hypothetical protein